MTGFLILYLVTYRLYRKALQWRRYALILENAFFQGKTWQDLVNAVTAELVIEDEQRILPFQEFVERMEKDDVE